MEINLKKAITFFEEWTEEESWKVLVFNRVITKTNIEAKEMLEEIIELMENKTNIDKVIEVDENTTDKDILVINEIKKPKNINALSSEINFSLGKNLNVFYGENGSGKSSYVRMFRRLANNYHTFEKNLSIIPNVYMKEPYKDDIEQVVETRYSIGEKEIEEKVNINQKHNALSKINVFDSDSIIPLINKDLSFSILPSGFENFQLASDLLDVLRIETHKTIENLTENQNKIFSDSSNDIIRFELSNIFQNVSSIEGIDKYIAINHPFCKNFKAEINKYENQINDLESSNSIDKIKLLNAQKKILELIKISFKELSAILNQENLEKINTLISNFELKIIEEQKFNQAFKEKTSFLDVINNEWIEFIKFGKYYFDSINKNEFHINDPCIFCSAPLKTDNITLIENNFKQISNINNENLSSMKNEIESFNIEIDIKLLESEEEALFESEKFIEKVKSITQLLVRNINIFNLNLNTKKTIETEVIVDVTDILNEIDEEINILDIRIEKLNGTKEQTEKYINELKVIKLNLEKNQKIYLLNKKIHEWYHLQNKIIKLNKIKGKFSTNKLTKKQNEAFKHIVQEEYIKTFEMISKDLNISNVNLKLTPKKGTTVRKKFVSSKEYKVTQIMSEGEQKAIAMAEFATDLKMRNDFNTILFDDPVTSLDYKRTELITNLIYELSKDRQVLVFTHNIMFYYMLCSICASPKNNENKFFKVDDIDKMNKGFVSESFQGRLENLKEVSKRLKKQHQEINSKSAIGDKLEDLLRKVYSDIRTWCELIFEEGFLKNTIRRHEPNIMFTKVKAIDGKFVDELNKISDLFEKSCRWMSGHSQSLESQNNRPSKEVFNEDIKYIFEVNEQYSTIK